MRDSRFFKPAGPFTVTELVAASGSTLANEGEGRLITDLAALNDANFDTLSFLDNPKYLAQLASCRAGAIVVAPNAIKHAPTSAALIINGNPRKAYALIAQLFYPDADDVPAGISPDAHISPTAVIGASCAIDAGAVIGANVTIGDGVYIGANTTIGRGVEIGNHSHLGPNVTLSHCIIGSRVRLLPGVRIGQAGFGFVIDRDGHVRVPQLGRVIIGDNVEIGANTTIDRGAGPDTVIGSGSMIDNLVQIGHNVRIGKGSVIVAQAGVSGSSQLGAFTEVGGQAGIAGHLSVGDGARIAGKSGVMRDVPAGESVMGYPALNSRRFFKQIAWVSKHAGTEEGK